MAEACDYLVGGKINATLAVIVWYDVSPPVAGDGIARRRPIGSLPARRPLGEPVIPVYEVDSKRSREGSVYVRMAGHYVIRGGVEGRERLRMLARVMRGELYELARDVRVVVSVPRVVQAWGRTGRE